jgi:hypothetical protein
VTAVVDGVVRVEVAAASPRGRQRYGWRMPTGRLVLRGDDAGGWRWEVVRPSDGVTVVAGRVGDPLDHRQSAVLAELGAVRCDDVRPGAGPGDGPGGRGGAGGRDRGGAGGRDRGGDDGAGRGPGAPPLVWAQVVAQLAVTGVVLHAPAPSDDTPGGPADGPAVRSAVGPDGDPGEGRSGGPPRGLLAPELLALLRAPLPGRGADPLAWEIRSVRQRRAALRHHGTGLTRPPAVSALLVTKRPQLLGTALAALAAQTYPELEIVVGLHGAPPATDLTAEHLTAEHLAAVAGGRPLRVVPVPESRPLGEALAEAARAASGTVLTKVDDDDRYGPEHVWDLVAARHYSGATVVGKGAEFVYLEPKDLTVRRRMAAETTTDTVAGGTIALAREDLAAVGGWPPVPRWVDRALLDRVLAEDGTVYRTHPLGFVYTRHGDGHTWEADLAYFLRDRVRSWRGLPPYDEFGAA